MLLSLLNTSTPEWRKQLLLNNNNDTTKLLGSISDIHGVTSAGIFGSYAKSTFTAKSDIDIFLIYDSSKLQMKSLKAKLIEIEQEIDSNIDFQIYCIKDDFGPISAQVTEGRIFYDKNIL